MQLVADSPAHAPRAAPGPHPLKGAQALAFTAYRRLLLNASVDITRSMASRSALVIAPHPDDETLGCGGAIARKTAAGARVHIAYITDGRHSHRSDTIPPDALARLRRTEATQAAAALGVPGDDLSFLDIPDGAAAASIDAIRARILELVQTLHPQDIFIPSPIDRHPDHRALGRLLQSLARDGALNARVLAYPVWFWTLKAWCDSPAHAHLALARMVRAMFTLRPVTVAAGEHLAAKRAALAAHKSQTTRLTGEPGWAVLDDAFVSHFLREREIYFQIAAPPSKELREPVAAPGFFRQVRILHMLPDLRVGGGQQLLLRAIDALDGRFDHHVCSIGPALDMHDAFTSAGAHMIRLNVRRPWQLPAALLTLIRTARQLNTDLVHTNNTGLDRFCGQIVALACRIPVVNTVHSEYEPPPLAPGPRGLAQRCARPARWMMERILARLTLRQSIAVSHIARESWRRSASHRSLRPSAFRVVQPAIVAAAFQKPLTEKARARLLAELHLEGTSTVLLCIGRLVGGKGQSILLDALPQVLAAHPDCTLLLAGDGPSRAEFEARAARLGIAGSVRFLGTRRDIPQLLQLADLLVFPSLREGFGLVLLEAMAAGKPAVASRLPVFREIVEDGRSAALFTPGDPADLARTLIQLLRDPARMAAMGARAREIAELRFSPARLADEMEAVYDAALARRR